MTMQSDSAFVENPSSPLKDFYLARLRMFAVLGAVATIAALFGEFNWIADLFSQFKFQWAFGMLALALLFLFARRWRWVLFCLIAFGVNAFPIWPYVSGALTSSSPSQKSGLETDGNAPQELETEPTFKLMSLNVLTSNRDWDGVVDLIKAQSADFVVLMEVDSTWEQVLRKDLALIYPYAKYESRLDNFGIAFLSKFQWDQIEVFNSETLRLPSIDVQYSQIGGRQPALPLRIIGTHPIPPMSKSNWDARNEQLFNVGGRFESESANIMVGDFNLSPWSPNFKKLLSQSGLSDASLSFGPAPTWYVFPTWVGGLKIDHALVGDNVRPLQLTVGPNVGSDHRAVILEFQISN